MVGFPNVQRDLVFIILAVRAYTSILFVIMYTSLSITVFFLSKEVFFLKMV